ncbi:MAG: NAD(P)/FAD-dependent oxidoreductase [Gammaproteobacteria bacterium]
MTANSIDTDVLIIGASASGLMCAIEAGKRGRKVVVLDHANKAGKKILMSGGGRCNFTNYDVSADNFISHNRHFCKSALSRYTQWDFIALVDQYNIPYHERDHGQLFCNDSAKDILDMLLSECAKVKIDIKLNCQIDTIENNNQTNNHRFSLNTSCGHFKCHSLVVACGGLSIPKMSASPLGYKIAEQFNHHIWPTNAGLVPFTLQPNDKKTLSELSGIAVESIVSNERIEFRENILFTHRGVSGPVILQVSSYWKPGEAITINLLPDINLSEYLKEKQTTHSKTKLKTILNTLLPKRLILALIKSDILDTTLHSLSFSRFTEIAKQLQQWQLKPNGTEGYRTAEVTLGGVDCNELSSKTMESTKVNGLYFIGEIVDITGWLGGYNFQWAWSSGWCAGQVV